MRKRGYLARTDWTPYGGANLSQGTGSGAVSGASSGAGSGTGYWVDANGNKTTYPGCRSPARSPTGT